jgi:hypothetical protein
MEVAMVLCPAMHSFGGCRISPARLRNWEDNFQRGLIKPSGYDYLRDIQTFGKMVSECISAQRIVK